MLPSRTPSGILLITIFLSVLYLFDIANCEQSAGPQADSTVDQIVIIDSSTVQLGNVKINRELGEITCRGWVNQDSSVVEYLAVTPSGKTHESVLVLDIRPVHLQLALLLLGLDYGQNIRFQGDSLFPAGDSVTIIVEWDSEGVTQSYPAHMLLLNYATEEGMEEGNWVFTGSQVYEGGFVADTDGSLIATYTDPSAILNNPSPERFDDSYIGVNYKIVPPVKTIIRMVIKKN